MFISKKIPSGGGEPSHGVATSITAFIGRALKGPPDESVVINNFSDYERQFGGLWTESTMSYAVQDFYFNGGSRAIIVRIHNGAGIAEILLPAASPWPPFVTRRQTAQVRGLMPARASVDSYTQDPTAPPASPSGTGPRVTQSYASMKGIMKPIPM